MSRTVTDIGSAVFGGMVALLRRWRGQETTVRIAADADAALLSSAAALRRLGARITRYDAAAGTLEARVPPEAGTVRLRAAASDEHTTHIYLEGDATAVIRRFRQALSA